MPLTPDLAAGKSARGVGGQIAKILLIVAVTLGTVGIGWATVKWLLSSPLIYNYSLIGDWRAESTGILGYQLPVGINLTFTERSARLVDTEIPVAEYDREGDRITVVLQPAANSHVSLTFVFEDRDRMYFDGPLGLKLRYKRVKVRAAS
jgi:hypothetical protein